MSPSPMLDKRAFCKVCIGGMTVCSVAAVAFPVVSFMGFPRRLTADKPLEVPLEKLAVGQAQYADFRGRQIVVIALEEGPQVLDAACTHLGCNVIWDTAESVFRCPCHGAVFDAQGQVVSGPVNQPLRPVPFTVEGSRIVVG